MTTTTSGVAGSAGTAATGSPFWSALTLDGLDKAMSLVLKLSFLYGGVWLFQYCYFVIGFAPSELSIGASVYWLFLSVAMGLVVFVLAAFGYALIRLLFSFLVGARMAGTHAGVYIGGSWRDQIRLYWHHYSGAILARLVSALLTVFAAWIFVAVMNPDSWGQLVASLGCAPVTLVLIGLGAIALVALILNLFILRSEFMDGLAMALFAAVATFLVLLAIERHAWQLIASMVFGGFCIQTILWIMASDTLPREQKPVAACSMAGVLLLAPLLVGGVSTQTGNFASKAVFHQIGLTKKDTNVVLTGAAAKTLRELVDKRQIAVLTCELADDALLVSGVDVPWVSLGGKTLVLFPGRRFSDPRIHGEALEAKGRIAFDAEQVSVVDDTTTRCAELATKVYFESGSAKLSDDDALQALSQDLREALTLVDRRWCVDRLVLTARSDQRPLAGNLNDQLAGRRATAVLEGIRTGSAEPLRSSFDCKQGFLGFESQIVGSREPVRRDCGLKGSASALNECEAANRVVKVSVLFARTPEGPHK